MRQIGQLLPAVRRDPRELQNLGRLLRTQGRSTIDVRLPWLPFAAIDFLEPRCSQETSVFEWGGGGSSLWFGDRVGQVVTVEHDDAWYRSLSVTVDSRVGTVVFAPLIARDGAEYVKAIDRYPDASLDIVLIDGALRVRCAEGAIPKLKPGGLLVLDDSERLEYAPVTSQCAQWERWDFAGFVPCKDRPGFTTIWRRP